MARIMRIHRHPSPTLLPSATLFPAETLFPALG